jgi:phage gpG-like protein
MAVTARLVGDKDMMRKLRKLSKIAPDRLAQEIAASALKIESAAKQAAPVDVGFLRAQIKSEFDDNGHTAAIGTNVEYGPHLEFGTKAHFPPVAPLEEWARRHGMPGAGYAIALKIARSGTEAQPFLFPASEAERPHFFRNCERALQVALREAASS